MAPSPELLGRLDPSASSYLQALRERVVIFDGAMGTNLQILGLSADDFGGPELEGCNEILIDSRPDLISQVHRSFFEVGCDVVETGTFGSSAVVLAEYGLQDRVADINVAAARLARQAADDHGRALARQLEVAVYIEEMFKTGNDDDNRAAVRAVDAADLSLVGLAVYGPKTDLDKVLKGLQLHP